MPRLNRRIASAVLVAALVVAGAACSDDDDTVAADGDETTSSTAPAPPFGGDGCTAADLADSTDLDAKPEITIPDCQPPSGLEQADVVVGEGEAAAAGDEVSVQYVGVSWSTGEQFDASWDRGEPFTFGLGQGQVIPGWDQGVVGMKPGGRRILAIPPDLAYGDQGAGEDIAPGETIVFVVDLVEVSKPVECAVEEIEVSADLATKPTITMPDCTFATELATADVVPGTGETAAAGDSVTVKYVGIAAASGEQFDASWDRGDDFEFELGAGQVITGWDEGVAGMQVGGRRTLLIPPDMAYGAAGSPPAIAPNATLVFVVDLVKVEKGS